MRRHPTALAPALPFPERDVLDEALFGAEPEPAAPPYPPEDGCQSGPPAVPAPAPEHHPLDDEARWSTVSDASGNYELATLAPGVYEILTPDTDEPLCIPPAEEGGPDFYLLDDHGLILEFPSPETVVDAYQPPPSDGAGPDTLAEGEDGTPPFPLPAEGYPPAETVIEAAPEPLLDPCPPVQDEAPAGADEDDLPPAAEWEEAPQAVPSPEELPVEPEVAAAELPAPARPPLTVEACTGMTLAPGEAVVLSPEMVRLSGAVSPFLIDLVLLSPPVYGTLCRDGFVLTAGDVFTQEDIDHGRVQYRHDGNARGEPDSFTFATPEGDVPAQRFSIELLPARRSPELVGCGQLGAVADGCRVADVLEGAVRVHEPDIEPGLAVVGVTGRGRWEFSLDGGVSWQTLGGVSHGRALLLGPTNLLRFVPAAGWSGVVRLTFRAWDRASGWAGEMADLAGRQLDGHSPFSREVTSATAAVSAAAAGDPGACPEPWKTQPSGLDLVGGGVAVVRLEGAGTWQFSLDGGTTWHDAGPVYHGNALLLRDGDRVRFLPRKGGAGKVILGGRTWDGRGGSPGARVNLAGRGTSGEGTPFGSFVRTRAWRLGG